MISMEHFPRRNRSLERDALDPPKFKTLSRSPSMVTASNVDYRGKIRCAKKHKHKLTFPQMVHQILEDTAKAGTNNILAWEDDGTSFHIYEPHVFNDTLLPRYSKKKTKFRSFQRQLNIYGFKMTKKSGVYRHPLFRRGHMGSIARMRPRVQQKKKASDRDEDDDSHSCTPTSLSLGNIDDEDAKTPQKVATTPLLRSISVEIGNSSAKRNGTNDSDELGTCDSWANYDKEAPHCTPFRIESRERDRSTCATTTAIGNSGFDLFDDLDDIKVCNCNGSGSCFIENLKF